MACYRWLIALLLHHLAHLIRLFDIACVIATTKPFFFPFLTACCLNYNLTNGSNPLRTSKLLLILLAERVCVVEMSIYNDIKTTDRCREGFLPRVLAFKIPISLEDVPHHPANAL